MPDEEYYRSVYTPTHYSGALGAFTRLGHRRLEHAFGEKEYFENVLEIGAHKGEHLEYLAHGFRSYVCSDVQVVEIETSDPRVVYVQADAEALPFEDCSFDRVLSMCVLLHLRDVGNALREIRRVGKGGALVSLYLPCDPGFVYRFVRHWVSHKKQAKLSGRSMAEVKHDWALEHRGHYPGVASLINWIFREDEISRSMFPFPLPWNLGLFATYHIRLNK